MTKLIENMIQYSKTGKRELLVSSDISMENKDINVVVINLLSWLKLEHKRTMWQLDGKKVKLKPLELNFQYAWCNNLTVLIAKEENFKNGFEISGNKLSGIDKGV